MTEFKVGDRVKLVAPFKWQGRADDKYWDDVIRQDVPDLIGTVLRKRIDGYYSVGWGQHQLAVDSSCIDHVVTEDEVQEAIKSILDGAP